MVISSFISSILVVALGVLAYLKLESSMNLFAERQLLIEPEKFSYKMWKDMPVTMHQSFTFFNLTNWSQVKSMGQKPRFVEVGPYVYRTIWSKSDVSFSDDEKQISFAEKKQWIFQAHLSKGSEDDQIWTINTPLMTALALIQNAPVITRNIVSVILDGLGEGAFIKRNIRSLLFEGYSDLIVSVGPLFDRRFANFNGKFAYLYNKNDSIDGIWTVSTGTDDIANLNKITKFQSNIVNMTGLGYGLQPQGLNEVKPECGPAWSLDQSTNGQLFTPFNSNDLEQIQQQQQILLQHQHHPRASSHKPINRSPSDHPSRVELATVPTAPKRFFSRNVATNNQQLQQAQTQQTPHRDPQEQSQVPDVKRDVGKFIFYPDLCRPIHLMPAKQEVTASNGIRANRYYIDARVFMNSTQVPTNKCYEMNPRPALANALAATINSVTGANVAMPSLVTGASSPFALFVAPSQQQQQQHQQHHQHHSAESSLFERSNSPGSFLNNALHSLTAAGTNQDHAPSSPISRLGRVRQLFSNIVSQRMSASPGSLLPSLANGPVSGMFIGNHHARNSPDDNLAAQSHQSASLARHSNSPSLNPDPRSVLTGQAENIPPPSPPPTGSDRWITQFRLKWPRGVFSIGQCQLGAPIYASLPHFLDADEYYLEQVDGLKPNRSLHEFYIDIESSLHSIPVGAKARLQLNVATPELRFRNIPNAMIPVLWQEVSFEIDKPIATMLYWSFTMSSSIYRLISILLIASGLALLMYSFVGCFRANQADAADSSSSNGDKQRVARSNKISECENNCICSETASERSHQSTSWRSAPTNGNIVASLLRRQNAVGQARNNTSSLPGDVLDEFRCHRANLNYAFSSSGEFNDMNTVGDIGRSGNQLGLDGSPKQPSSRASSHCELMGTLNCSGCLLACLRHSPAGGGHNVHDHNHSLSDNSLVRQQQQTTTYNLAQPTELATDRANKPDAANEVTYYSGSQLRPTPQPRPSLK